LGNSERLGVTGLKTGHYKRPLQEAIANAIAKAAAPFAGLQRRRWKKSGHRGDAAGFVYWTTSVS
jgi:hypothetical protein